jgi:branched-chain amino acid transport system ATP-binding protein
MLRIDGLAVAYGRIAALHGIDLEVGEREIVALLGANGAGKSTLLRAVSGLQPAQRGQVIYQGVSIDRVKAYERVSLGIAHAPEGRQIFKSLSVEDNLRLGAYRRRDPGIRADIEKVYAMFPVLGEMRKRTAADLSGGQQQMLAIGRALAGAPRLLLLDEPSLGLAPKVIDQIFNVLVTLRAQGMTILVVEQNAAAALSIADRGYVLETGRIVHSGPGHSLLADPSVRSAYLGL